jgi:hypothetical protein
MDPLPLHVVVEQAMFDSIIDIRSGYYFVAFKDLSYESLELPSCTFGVFRRLTKFVLVGLRTLCGTEKELPCQYTDHQDQ